LLFDPVGDDVSVVASNDIDESALIQRAEEVDVRSFAVVLDAPKSECTLQHARCIDSTTETCSIAFHLGYHVHETPSFQLPGTVNEHSDNISTLINHCIILLDDIISDSISSTISLRQSTRLSPKINYA